MCALFGWLDYKGIVPYKVLKKLTQALANAAEERGTDAAGISYIKDGKVTIFKRPKPAHRIHFNAPENTTAIMGHTRMATQGDKKHNYNNHPFHGQADKEFAFAHNGVLYNDEELHKKNLIPDTHIETDSYAACQLLEQQSKLDFDSLQFMAETVQGNFTFTLLDEDNSLYIIKGSNPICLLHFEALGIYVYASTESIMNNALKRIGMYSFQFERIEAVEGDIIQIDRNGFLSRSEYEIHRYSKFVSWYGDDEGYYNAHEQLLLDMCGCFGVNEEDVLMLLDYGYSADEVESMLMDYDMIASTVRAIKYADAEDCFGIA